MWPCERLDAIDSTQRELQRRLAMPGCVDQRPSQPFAAWTTQQNQGIASHGRSWLDASRGLAFSVAWPESLSGNRHAAWPVRVSLAVASMLEACCPELTQPLGVKWPNDIMCGQAKLAGVLVSRHASAGQAWLIAGVGINLDWLGKPQLNRQVTSLVELGVRQIDEECLVSALAKSFDRLWAMPSDDASWQKEFEMRDVHDRCRVSVVHPISGQLLHEGIAEGVSERGELMLRIGEQRLAIQIGEVSVRPQISADAAIIAKALA